MPCGVTLQPAPPGRQSHSNRPQVVASAALNTLLLVLGIELVESSFVASSRKWLSGPDYHWFAGRHSRPCDTWNCSLVSIARAQATEQVLDSTYVPILPDEIALFAEKQMYMYSVLQRAVQTDEGKAIVRSHEATFDAQKVYKEMYGYCSKSTRAVSGSRTNCAEAKQIDRVADEYDFGIPVSVILPNKATRRETMMAGSSPSV